MSGMVEVLAAHRVSSVRTGSHAGLDHMPDIGVYEQRCQTCGKVDGAQSDHQAAMLTAAGFGPVKEAAAAGLRSVQDIWGAGGRVTVPMGEIRDADQAILSGEWDNHIKWNMADIAKERARSAAVRGEG